jgi:copper(I)-binding protein
MPPTALRSWRPAAAALAALALALAGCGDDEPTTATESGAGAVAEGDAPSVAGAWARSSADGQSSGAVYLEITSNVEAAVVGASVPSDIAGTIQLHETVTVAEDGAMDDEAMEDGAMDDEAMDDMAGTMSMQAVDQIALPAGETVVLEPGGLPVMLLDLTGPLVAGDTFELTLSLDDGSSVPVEIEVLDQQP